VLFGPEPVTVPVPWSCESVMTMGRLPSTDGTRGAADGGGAMKEKPCKARGGGCPGGGLDGRRGGWAAADGGGAMKEKRCKARGGGGPGGGLDGRRGRESQGVHDEGPAPSGGGR